MNERKKDGNKVLEMGGKETRTKRRFQGSRERGMSRRRKFFDQTQNGTIGIKCPDYVLLSLSHLVDLLPINWLLTQNCTSLSLSTQSEYGTTESNQPELSGN